MKKHITLFGKESLFGDSSQELWDIDDRKKLYGVSDLSECSEDVELDKFIQDYLGNADTNNDKQNKNQYLSSASTNIGEVYTSRVA